MNRFELDVRFKNWDWVKHMGLKVKLSWVQTTCFVNWVTVGLAINWANSTKLPCQIISIHFHNIFGGWTYENDNKLNKAGEWGKSSPVAVSWNFLCLLPYQRLGVCVVNGHLIDPTTIIKITRLDSHSRRDIVIQLPIGIKIQ